MENLEYVLNDFYNFLSIPIKYFDKNWNTILNKGYNESSTLYFNKLNILENCKKDTSTYTEISYNNIHFLKFNFLIRGNLKGYFIIGPFKSDNSQNEVDLPFKPYSCIKYIKDTFNALIRDRLKSFDNYNYYVFKAIQYIHKNYNKDICINDVCNFLGINKSYFCSLFKKETGLTFCNFLNKFRIEMSKKFLFNRDYSIMDVSLCVGYNNHNYYSSLFKKLNNITPLEFRNTYSDKNSLLTCNQRSEAFYYFD